jgi:hypothetical protein
LEGIHSQSQDRKERKGQGMIYSNKKNRMRKETSKRCRKKGNRKRKEENEV